MTEFKLLDELDEWTDEHYKKCKTRDCTGAQFEYSFIPTGIGEIQTVKCLVCNKEHTVYND